MGKKRIVNKGDVFGRLTVVDEVEPQHYIKKSGLAYTKRVFKMQCSCDLKTVVNAQLNHLVTGKILGCGCVRLESLDIGGLYFRTTHGMTGTPTYQTWEAMKTRCGNPKYADWYSDVTVCERWCESFQNFFDDMGERPEGCTLNRVRGCKVYSKETCEWASLGVQSYDQKRKSNNKSGRTGVCFDNTRKLWMAYIGVENKHIWLGHYRVLDDAIKARETAELEYYGFTKQ